MFPHRSYHPYTDSHWATHLTVLELRSSKPDGFSNSCPADSRSYRNVAYRHALPPPPGAGNDCRNGRSWSTAGATEEAEGRAGWGKHSPTIVETGEGGTPPSHLSVLKLAPLALPVSPSPSGDIPTVQCTGPIRSPGARPQAKNPLNPAPSPRYASSPLTPSHPSLTSRESILYRRNQ